MQLYMKLSDFQAYLSFQHTVKYLISILYFFPRTFSLINIWK